MAPRFTADTVVADAIAADPGVIDRLIALNPTFRKLKNPVLRKVMARLVTFGEAAKVAGVPLEAMLAAANGQAPAPLSQAAPRPSESEAAPAWVGGIDRTAATHLDVRPILAQGGEPLSEVMRTAAKIAEGGVLILEAPFDPAPLRRVLANKGFEAHGECLAPDHWRIYFRRGARVETARAAGPRLWREHDTPHIDVRGLEPPEPMLAILRLLEDADTGDTVIVHHEREPLFLYPELDERGWAHAVVPGDSGEVRLRLTRS